MTNKELYDYVKELKLDIKEVKSDTKGTYEEVKKINGRLRKVEGDIIRVDGVVEARGITCAKKLEDLVPSIPLMRHLNAFSKSPKIFLLLFIGFIIGVQTLILEAVQNNWLSQLLMFLKP